MTQMMTTGKNPPAPRRALGAAWLLVAALACAQGEREQASTDTNAGPTVDSAAAGVVPAAPTRVDSSVRATPADSVRRTATDTGTRTARQTTPAASAA
ncbi:MAG TPA: hypothetical protein VNA89_15160, partial [Gemmatimonadaceae bacterium]|nr:hypothetical protein [Gemmatimonadaceae bacterium]